MHKFSPDDALRLERPERYKLIPPHQTLRSLGLAEGMVFADIGTGTGFFARAASDIVGQHGTVYAIDMSDQMLAHLRNGGLPANIVPIHSGEYDIPLPDGTADFAFLAFVAHETPDLERFLTEISRIGKPGIPIAFVEWKKQAEENGPPMEERLDQRDLEAYVRRLFRTTRSGELNASHYFVIAQ